MTVVYMLGEVLLWLAAYPTRLLIQAIQVIRELHPQLLANNLHIINSVAAIVVALIIADVQTFDLFGVGCSWTVISKGFLNPGF
jgi:hypothetical protein